MTAAKRTPPQAASATKPQSVRLIRPFGFIADNGTEYFWRADQKVVDSYEIDLLVRYGASVEIQKCPDQ